MAAKIRREGPPRAAPVAQTSLRENLRALHLKSLRSRTEHSLTVKQVRALRHRRERDASGLFVAEGIRLVAEALDLGVEIETVVVAPPLLRGEFGRELDKRARAAGVARLEISASEFANLSRRDGPQGVAVVARQRWERLDAIDPSSDFCWVALDAAQDPGNVGTILRTADAVGASGLILLGPTADPHDPTAVRASMGAIFAQRLIRAEFDELAGWCRRHGVMLVGMSDAAAVEYRVPSYRAPIVLLGGSEREGLSVEQQSRCDVTVRIPMVGRSDSLNLAVATGIVLYELFNRRPTE